MTLFCWGNYRSIWWPFCLQGWKKFNQFFKVKESLGPACWSALIISSVLTIRTISKRLQIALEQARLLLSFFLAQSQRKRHVGTDLTSSWGCSCAQRYRSSKVGWAVPDLSATSIWKVQIARNLRTGSGNISIPVDRDGREQLREVGLCESTHHQGHCAKRPLSIWTNAAALLMYMSLMWSPRFHVCTAACQTVWRKSWSLHYEG